MKFTLSLKYNAVPEWQDAYINYAGLKKTVYSLQAKQLEGSSSTGAAKGSEDGSSLEHNNKRTLRSWMKQKTQKSSSTTTVVELQEYSDPEAEFLEKLQHELLKIDDFYKVKERELYIEYENLLELVNRDIEETRSMFSHKVDEEYDDDDHDDTNSALLSDADLNASSRHMVTLKRRTTQLFVDISQLKSFVELNRLGFGKITKKFDKLLGRDLRARLIDSNEFFKDCYTFAPTTMVNLDSRLDALVEAYAATTGRHGSLEACKTELRSHLREQIVWERATVWREMIGLESRAATVNIKGTTTETPVSDLTLIEYYSWPLPYTVNLGFTKFENFLLPKFLNTPRAYKLAIIIAVTGILLGVKTFNDAAEHRCMALLACVALLWATEAIPLFATALLCPLLVVMFKVSKDDDGKVMAAAAASSFVLGQMWSSTLMVLLGGFTLAAALSKYNIAKIAASWILAGAGTKPRNILLAIMGVSLFLSMWISNVATPVLCYSLIHGVLRGLDTDSDFAKALVLGIALASDIGGMPSPIASPQNIVAMEYLTPYGIGWGQWLAVGVPVSIISMVLVWLLLILTFKVNDAKIAKYRPIREKLTAKQWYVVGVFIGTIILWCVETQIESEMGSAGIIAVFPIVLFFGTGLLTTADINSFPWTIVILAMGSLSLGKAISSSGLLGTIARALQKRVIDFDMIVILFIFGILILVIGTFVSHTVSAIIIIPLVQEIGDALPESSAAPVLIFGTALLSSCGMGLASSGFPNVTAISMVDDLGARYLSVANFITRGVPASFIGYIVVCTVGYGIMKATIS